MSAHRQLPSQRKKRRMDDSTTAEGYNELEQLEHDAALLEEHVHVKTTELQQLKDRIELLRETSPELATVPTRGKKNPRCKAEGCTKYAQRRGLCTKHGGKHEGRVRRKCSAEGCTNQVQQGGVCYTHGATKHVCGYPGCINKAHIGGLCDRHNAAALRRCSHEGCTTLARKGGVCMRHGSEPKICSFEGCMTPVQQGGLCSTHGVKKVCNYPYCKNLMQVRGLCGRHDRESRKSDADPDSQLVRQSTPAQKDGSREGKKICNYSGCKNLSKVRGKCTRHDMESQDEEFYHGMSKKTPAQQDRSPSHLLKKICNHPECTNFSKIRGKCTRHDRESRKQRKNEQDEELKCETTPVQQEGSPSRGGKKICNHPECTNLSKVRGKCSRHDRESRPQCENEQDQELKCETTPVQQEGSPRRDREKLICNHPECTNWSKVRGKCTRHDRLSRQSEDNGSNVVEWNRQAIGNAQIAELYSPNMQEYIG